MNFKKTLLFSVYIFLILEILGHLIFYFLPFFLTPERISDIGKSSVFNFVSLGITVLIVALFCFLYLKNKKLKNKILEGFYFGLIVAGVGVIEGILIRTYIRFVVKSQIEILFNPLTLQFLKSVSIFIIPSLIVGFLIEKFYRSKMQNY